MGNERESPPTPREPTGSRCQRCVFQEPPWSQGYAGCSHSWLHDRDGDCRGFYDRDGMLARFPAYADFCHPPGIFALPRRLLRVPYWSDGSRYADFRPSCNLPSAYYARLNLPDWVQAGAWKVYAAVEQERLRRFWQWAEEETIRQVGFFQGNLFLSLLDSPEMPGGNDDTDGCSSF